MLERETELEALEGRLDAARDGDGNVVVVEGPAGIGKTALMQELQARAEQRGATVLAARGGELEQDLAFGLVRGLFERTMLSLAGEEREDVLYATTNFFSG